MSLNFQEIIFQELRDYLEPILQIEGNPEAIFDLFQQMGWDLDLILGGNHGGLINGIQDTINSISSLSNVIDNPPQTIGEFIESLENVTEIFRFVKSLPTTIPGPVTTQLQELPVDLLEYLTLTYLKKKSLFAYQFLALLTIIKEEEPEFVVVGGNIVRVKNAQPKLRLSQLPKLLSNPGEVFAEEYWPGGLPDLATTNEAAKKLFTRIQLLLSTIGITTFVGRGSGPDELSAAEEERLEGLITFKGEIPLSTSDGTVELGASIGILPQNEGGPGVYVSPFGSVAIGEVLGNWYFQINTSLGLDGFQITANGLEIYEGNGTTSELLIGLSPLREGGVDILVGSATGTRFEVKDFQITGGFSFSNRNKEVKATISLYQAAFVLMPGDGDGFLQKVLPEDGVRIGFDLNISWSNHSGFHFEGSGGLELLIPIHQQILGVINIETINTSLYISSERLSLAGALTGGVELGPFVATIENVGIKADISFPSDGGNLGPINIAPGFKPPNGIGLVIDSGAVKGGGYLFIDPDKGEYAGVAELTIQETISVKAIGIINTKLPNGQKGFSLLLLISVEFTPIQLGFGFTLNGIGGLIGAHRSMNLEALRQGVKNNTLDHILFPEDPVANAPQIIASLNTVFPIVTGQFTFGIMGIIGWGTPTLIQIEAGLMIEIPDPVRIALLGVVKAVLPNKDSPLLQLQVNFLGTIDFEKKLLTFDASLYDSRLLSFTLSGDMALRLSWGDSPHFLLSVGGFHPDYQPPPLNLPTLERITLNLLGGNNPRLTLTSYFAVTSNTVQFGAGIDFLFKISKFKVVGFLYFDALFQFSPFYFKVSIAAGLAVKLGSKTILGIHISGSLEGPTPWRVKGKGKFKILFFKFTVKFSKTFGERRNNTLPDIRVLPKLKEALEDNRNWVGSLSHKANLLTTLRDLRDELSGSEGENVLEQLIVHPFGILSVNQTVLPLDIQIDKLGNHKPADYHSFSLNLADKDGIQFEKTNIKDHFAPAEYFELSNSEKLSRKSFEKYNSGVSGKGTEELNADFFPRERRRIRTNSHGLSV